jgi:hypothetical protein
VAAAIVAAAVIDGASAAAQTTPMVARFTATAGDVGRAAGDTVRIDVLRWSTDEEREKTVAALGAGAAALGEALRGMPSLGYVWTGSSAGYFIRYAYRLPLDGGGERVILATDPQLGARGGAPWQAAEQRDAPEAPYTVIELRLPAKGAGEGKLSVDTGVAAAADGKTIELADYGNAAVLLTGVSRAATAS